MKHSNRSVVLFFSVILCALFVRIFIFDVLYVSGPSMSPTLPEGSLVFEYKLAFGIPVPFSNRYFVRWGAPKKQDIVVYPWLGRNVVKRCLAVEGDELVFCERPGYSVETGGSTISLSREQFAKLKDTARVPAGMIFAVGDNRGESRDSRDYGFVSIDSIRGKALWK